MAKKRFSPEQPMPTFAEVKKMYPGWSDEDILTTLAERNNVSREYVVGYLGYDPSKQLGEELGVSGNAMSVLINYPYLIFLKFFIEALPAAALAYGLVWLVMRPKDGSKLQNPFLWHSCGVFATVVASGIFRTIAMVTFAGRAAYEPAIETGAAGFYMLIIPAIIAAGYFMWLKKSKLLSASAVSSVAPSVAQPGLPLQPVGTGGVATPATTNMGNSAPVAVLVDEDAIYAAIGKELETGSTDKGLWTRLFAEYDGDENRTKVVYIKQRAEKLKSIERTRFAARQKADATLKIIEQLRLNGYEIMRTGGGWKIIDPLGGHLNLDSDDALLEYAKGLA